MVNSLQWFGFLASLFIGLSLGVLGGGGSILTLPVLVYLLGINPVLSTAYSLFVVGTTSLVGSVNYIKQQQVSFKAAAYFALPSFLAVLLTRNYLLPAIPDPVWSTPMLVLGKDTTLMVLFSVIMLVAAYRMIRPQKTEDQQAAGALVFNIPLLIGEGLLVGILTGLVGAGGGFLIIPALVLLAHLPMKTAVGTSLFIIALNSMVGFLGDVSHLTADWPFLLAFTSLSILGLVLGTRLARYIPGEKLKSVFGWLLLVMGAFILSHEIVQLIRACDFCH
ncbi:sulfite exporter TauE/SafE family protein [Larkinella arboricola]